MTTAAGCTAGRTHKREKREEKIEEKRRRVYVCEYAFRGEASARGECTCLSPSSFPWPVLSARDCVHPTRGERSGGSGGGGGYSAVTNPQRLKA